MMHTKWEVCKTATAISAIYARGINYEQNGKNADIVYSKFNQANA